MQAPLITLFGERLTKQFLSESISPLDNVIFALSPLGVLTAVVSVIRICGSSSLRAFVGRAQEGPAEAESELLPCVSESTAELFNDGGVARVFGRPKIMEIVSWEENHNNGGTTTRMGTMKEALEQGAWSCKGKTAPSELPELDIPNLSLNKGIKRRGQGWFYCAAVLGGVLQSGQFHSEFTMNCTDSGFYQAPSSMRHLRCLYSHSTSRKTIKQWPPTHFHSTSSGQPSFSLGCSSAHSSWNARPKSSI